MLFEREKGTRTATPTTPKKINKAKEYADLGFHHDR